MNKKRLRSIYLNKRINLQKKEKQFLENKIYSLFQTLSFDFPINIFLSYKPIQEKNEMDISLIEEYVALKYKKPQKCYPVMLTNNELEIMAVTKDTVFSKNEWNIEEPINGIPICKKKLDLILTPLLIFDENGFRIGYGKGMYDGLLSACKKDVLKIGFCFFPPVEKIEDIQDYDMPLDMVITPEKIFRFK